MGISTTQNKIMQTYRQNAKIYAASYELQLVFKTIGICWPEFVEIDQCVLMESQVPKSHVKRENLDRTGYEAFVNHIHIADHIDLLSGRPLEALLLCMKIAEMWACKLRSEFPNRIFQIVLSCDDDECNLRFYTVRDDEEPWLDVTSISKFEEGIMVWTVNG